MSAAIALAAAKRGTTWRADVASLGSVPAVACAPGRVRAGDGSERIGVGAAEAGAGGPGRGGRSGAICGGLEIRSGR